jgi:hypothetical protein
MINAKCMIFLPSDLERIRRIFYLNKRKNSCKDFGNGEKD